MKITVHFILNDILKQTLDKDGYPVVNPDLSDYKVYRKQGRIFREYKYGRKLWDYFIDLTTPVLLNCTEEELLQTMLKFPEVRKYKIKNILDE